MPSWIRSRKLRPRLRYFLAMLTPPAAGCRRTGRAWPARTRRTAASRSRRACGAPAGSSSVMSIRSCSSFSRLARSSLAARLPCSASTSASSSSIRVADLLQLLHQRLDLLRADRQLLDQRDGLAAAERGAGGGGRRCRPPAVRSSSSWSKSSSFCSIRCSSVRRLCGIRWRILSFSRFSVWRHLDGAVERQVAGVDALERLDDLAQGVVALQHLAAEAAAGDLDLLGQGDFLLAVEQRDLAHLGEVHAHRVVDAAAVAVGVLERGQVGVGEDDLLGDGDRRPRRAPRRRPRR